MIYFRDCLTLLVYLYKKRSLNNMFEAIYFCVIFQHAKVAKINHSKLSWFAVCGGFHMIEHRVSLAK